MFECLSGEADRILVALDCDIAVIDDFSSGLSHSAVCGVPASVSPLRPNEWLALLSLLDLRPDNRNLKTINTLEELPVPYLNSGVLFIPAKYGEALTDRWRHYIGRLLTLRTTLNWPDGIWFYLDQIALTCALLAAGLPVEVLDVTYNFPTNVLVQENAIHGNTDIRVLHYHRKLRSSGALLPAQTPLADRAIQRFNCALSRHINEKRELL
jgi:hypothetical protein